MRRQLICERTNEDDHFDKQKCIVGDCDTCQKGNLFVGKVVCSHEMLDKDDPANNVSWEKWDKRVYVDKHGQQKYKMDFIEQENSTIQAVQERLVEIIDDFHFHHHMMKWQAMDKRVLRENPRLGTVSEVQDFSQNGSIKPKNEHQSRYFSEVSYTLYGSVMTWHIDDLGDITDDERERLRKLLTEAELPLVVTETHCIITPDPGITALMD